MNPFVRPRDIEDACRERGVAVQAYFALSEEDMAALDALG